MRRAVIACVVALVLAPAFAAAQVFKWVDESGKVHYGQQPPPGVKASPVGVPSGPPAAPAQPTWKDKDLEFQRRRIEREKKESVEGDQARARDAQREGVCSEHRRRLATLQEQIPIYQRNDKGERVYIEDKDRPAEIAKHERFIAENCR